MPNWFIYDYSTKELLYNGVCKKGESIDLKANGIQVEKGKKYIIKLIEVVEI
ncbi:MAG: hypothetical protein AMQ22_00093 [Candidatus Methanofastidiosum methylothiophilum]|uniref:Uncharacterized protein n=1 Tax=Candidatus Methanofastidiosum methylothiophilum TaxID=1705564 RepID=A0A150J9F1_9EURY|nr:MAG: hypothetical protein AMQ22_00093 [Candidatus Methanofastidiosum methylthiophilus]